MAAELLRPLRSTHHESLHAPMGMGARNRSMPLASLAAGAAMYSTSIRITRRGLAIPLFRHLDDARRERRSGPHRESPRWAATLHEQISAVAHELPGSDPEYQTLRRVCPS